MSELKIKLILSLVTYKPGWKLQGRIENGVLDLFWLHERPDAVVPGLIGVGESGHTYIPVDRIRDEEHLVRLAFSNALACEEHECREFFRYKGERTFNPHATLIPKKAADDE